VKRPKFLGPRQGIKVLLSGRSFHGGKLKWPLPKLNTDGTYEPGAWLPKTKVAICNTGYHLTYAPQEWWSESQKCVAYVVEYRGKRQVHNRGDKFAVPEVRLLRPLTVEELEQFGIFHGDGEIPVKKLEGHRSIYVGGTARLTLDKRTRSVKAYGRSVVTVSTGGTVTLYEQARADVFSGGEAVLYGGTADVHRGGQARAYNGGTIIVRDPGAYGCANGSKAKMVVDCRDGSADVASGAICHVRPRAARAVVRLGSDARLKDEGTNTTVILHDRNFRSPEIERNTTTVIVNHDGSDVSCILPSQAYHPVQPSQT